MRRSCSPRPRRAWACIRSRARRPTSPSPTPTPTAAAWRRAPIAASANGSAAPIIPRPVPQTCVLPALIREPTFEARTDSEVTKVNLSGDGKTATGVTYVDRNGEEWEQPADLVLLCAYGLFNVRLMLLSGIGKPYDPATRRRRGRAQLRLPDRLRLDGVFRGCEIQSVRRGGFARRRRRRLQQRQFRSWPARLRRRRLDHLRLYQRPADPVSPDAARARRPGAANGRRRSTTPISASPVSARRAAS